MDAKPYVIAITIQVIYTSMFVIIKAAFNQGFNTFIFVFYSQATASLLLLPIAVLRERKNVLSMSLGLLLKLFLCALIGNTFSINMLNVALRYTSATVQSAISNSKPVVTFCLALLLRIEVVKLRSTYGIAKGFVVTGVLNYLQVWCMEMRGPVFLAIWFPLCFVFTIFASSFLGEIIHLGSILGRILLVGGLYSVLWAKSKESTVEQRGEVNVLEDAHDKKGQKKHQENTMGSEEQDEEAAAYAVEQL